MSAEVYEGSKYGNQQKKSHLKEMTFFAQIMKKLLLKIIKQCYLLF